MAEETLRREVVSAPKVKVVSRRDEAIVFCCLALLGGGLLSVVLIAHVDYFYPYMFYLLVVFIAWQRYFQRGSKRRIADVDLRQAAYVAKLRKELELQGLQLREEHESGKIISE